MPLQPILALTSGDPGGIGPEVAVAAMREPSLRRACRILAVGPRSAFVGAGWTPSLGPLLDPAPSRARRFPRGPSGEGGRLSYAAVRAAVELCARGLADAVVTAPVSKESWRMAGVPHLDHTALLQGVTRSPRAAMMLLCGDLRAVLVTRHVPLGEVPALLSAEGIEEAAELAELALRVELGIGRPRLALCALNPHAGEGGLLGREEKALLSPTARRLRRRGLDIAGPLPADSAWGAHAKGRYDALISLYHDQALIGLKAAGACTQRAKRDARLPRGDFRRRAYPSVVNWTLGIPLVRTSPGHGTAYDIAGRGVADPSAMRAAARLALDIVLRRRER